MHSPLAQIAALAALGSPPIETRIPPDLEFASVAVTDGMVGGFIGPTPCVLLAAAYDRVTHGFRVVRRKDGPPGDDVWVAEIGPDRFRALLDLAVASGLPELPLESPPSCTDIYDRSRQIRLNYGKVRWANGAPGGCTSSRSEVMPSQDEIRRFDGVVARLENAVDSLPLRRGSRIDLSWVPVFEDVLALESYRRAMEHVLADPIRHSLDLERVSAWNNWARFCRRGQDADESGGDVQFQVQPSGAVVRYYYSSDARREPGPIETGMTLVEVQTCLGPPDESEERGDGSLVVTYRPIRKTGWRTPAPARLRFENGRLSSP